MNIALIFSVICLLFCFFIFLYVKWYIKRRTSTIGLLPEEKTEVNRLIVEINAVTDRNLLLVEDKIKQLKEILEDTDKRISVYVKELEKSRSGEALYTSLGRGIRAALKTPPEPAPQPPASPSALAAPPLPQAVTPAAPLQAELLPQEIKPPSKKQIRAQITALTNEGIAPAEIASRLGISIGEVDLALNLNHRGTNRAIEKK